MSQLAVLPNPNFIFIHDTPVPLNAPHGAPSDVLNWVAQVVALTEPDRVHWCDGSPEERKALRAAIVADGSLPPSGRDLRSGRPAHSAAPASVSRTFVCSFKPEDTDPASDWMHPTKMRQTLARAFDGSMRGRTMYVVPFSTDPLGEPTRRVGIQITDSPAIAVELRITASVGAGPLALINAGVLWVPAVHSAGRPTVPAAGGSRPEQTGPRHHENYTAHFPESREIWSYVSGFTATTEPTRPRPHRQILNSHRVTGE